MARGPSKRTATGDPEITDGEIDGTCKSTHLQIVELQIVGLQIVDLHIRGLQIRGRLMYNRGQRI